MTQRWINRDIEAASLGDNPTAIKRVKVVLWVYVFPKLVLLSDVQAALLPEA
jgi:hypothetical protein